MAIKFDEAGKPVNLKFDDKGMPYSAETNPGQQYADFVGKTNNEAKAIQNTPSANKQIPGAQTVSNVVNAIKEDYGPIAGSIALPVIGTAVASTPPGLLGLAGLAALGGIAGRAGQRGVENKPLYVPSKDGAGQTAIDTGQLYAKEALLGAGGELAGAGIRAGAKLLPAVKEMIPTALKGIPGAWTKTGEPEAFKPLLTKAESLMEKLNTTRDAISNRVTGGAPTLDLADEAGIKAIDAIEESLLGGESKFTTQKLAELAKKQNISSVLKKNVENVFKPYGENPALDVVKGYADSLITDVADLTASLRRGPSVLEDTALQVGTRAAGRASLPIVKSMISRLSAGDK